MKLRDLTPGQRFIFANGSGKRWRKISDNGDIAEYNYCECLDGSVKRSPMMLDAGHNDHRMNKNAEVIIID
jgi:hypothetical protein